MNKFLKVNKLYKINIKLTSILKYNLIITNFYILKKINNINKWNNKKMKIMNHLMNFFKIYMKIIRVNNKYLKQFLKQLLSRS